MSLPSAALWTVDVFAKKPYEGNPAGVMVLPAFLPDLQLAAIAQEVNLSETAFVVRQEEGTYQIRWFTPKEEAPFCVHATLAAAHILWENNLHLTDSFVFDSLAGSLPIKLNRLTAEITITLPLQLLPACPHPDPLLQEALGVEFVNVYFGETRAKSLSSSLMTSAPWITSHYVVELETQDQVIQCIPHFETLTKLPCRAITLTAPSSPPYDFISRYFAPRVGIPEDFFCGSAHCRLAPLWSKKLNKSNLQAHSGSSRGGSVSLSCTKDELFLTSTAITLIEGKIRLP